MHERIKKEVASRQIFELSPWVSVATKSIQETDGTGRINVYHSVVTPDYVSVLPILEDGRIPIVIQYRPAVEQVTFEFPGGLCDANTEISEVAKQEMAEEVGLQGGSLRPLGILRPDTGRLENYLHAFVCLGPTRIEGWQPEPGIRVEFVTPKALLELIRKGTFNHSQHLALLCLAVFNVDLFFAKLLDETLS